MTRYRHRLVFAAACMGMLIFGIAVTTLGAVLPSVIARFGLGRASAGSLFTLLSAGILAGSLVFGPIVDRHGYRGLLMAGILAVLAGLEAIALAPSMAVMATATVLVGVGGGVINGGTSALVADISTHRTAGLSLLGVFFGVGAAGLPAVLGVLLEGFGYSTVIAGIGALLVLPLAYHAVIRFPAPKQPQGVPLRRLVGLARDPALVLLGLVLFIQSGIEMTVGGWTATYFQDELGVEPERALHYLALFWLGMTGGRLALPLVLRRLQAATALFGSLAVAFVGVLILFGSPTATPAAVGVVLTGGGFAAVFPVVLGYAGDRYPDVSGSAFSFVFVLALVGGSTLPYATGVLADALGLRPSLLVLPVALCASALLFHSVRRRLGGASPGRVP
jgi:FHS family glucose/mannose:H+ symporter-like MFS transporter